MLHEREGCSILTLHGVSKGYGPSRQRVQAVHPLSLNIRQGDIHGIIGASGAGKSTLLRLMNRLEDPDEGAVLLDGVDLMQMKEPELREARRSIGMIFQHFHLLGNKTVAKNIAIPLELAKLDKRERSNRVLECLGMVGLLDKAEQYPAQLSGGQKQRVAIARALANRPKVLLCDEPTSALDPHTTNEVLEVLRTINQTFGLTIIIVTHELEVIRSICHRVSMMENGKLLRTLEVDSAGLAQAAELFSGAFVRNKGDEPFA